MNSMEKNINQVLPLDIISDILTRIPAESVLESKSVCKTWKSLIQRPSFPKLHLDRLNHPDSSDSGMLRYVISHPDDGYDYRKSVYYFEFNENEDWNYVKPDLRQIRIETPFEAYILIGSFNGLICIYGIDPDLDEIQGPALIFNPVTREYVVLPEPEYDQTKGSKSVLRYLDYLEGCGFGYLAETNEYKVVRMYRIRGGVPNSSLEVEVYTAGSGKGWRHVGKFDFYAHWKHRHGVFLNGCLHWRDMRGMVVVFDLAREKFREHIPPPPLLTGTDDDRDYSGSIVMGVSGGGILYYAVGQSVQGHDKDDVWLLVEKNDNRVIRGEQVAHQSQGWSKLTSLDQREPFAFMRGGSVLRYDQGNLKVFESSTSTWKKFVNFYLISRQVYPHKHTLVSLKELGEEDAEIMKPRI